jgi:hypothetical protein
MRSGARSQVGFATARGLFGIIGLVSLPGALSHHRFQHALMAHSTFDPALTKLAAPQRQLWPQLAPLAKQGWVLHGGTAIALRLGHRDSVDFDFFTEAPLDRKALLDAFPPLADAPTIQDEPNTYTAIACGVKVSFFGSIAFGRIGHPQITNDGVAIVASLEDLMAQKLKVVMQRAESKDYRDVAALLRVGQSLQAGMAGASALYGMSFSPMECAKALVYFKGGDLAMVPPADRTTLTNAVRALRLTSFAPAAVLSMSLAS